MIHWTEYKSDGNLERRCDNKYGEIINGNLSSHYLLSIVETNQGLMSWNLENVTCRECNIKIDEQIDLIAERSNN